MMHCKPAPERRHEHGVPACDASVCRECFAVVETLTAQVRTAKQTADETLRRALEAPEPHETTNTIFVALWEAHLHDREALFATMRRLDAAREELRRVVAAFGAAGDPATPSGRRQVG